MSIALSNQDVNGTALLKSREEMTVSGPMPVAGVAKKLRNWDAFRP